MMAMLNKMSNVEKEVAEEYASSLADLTVNSKPLINMLTILAHENIMHAPVIVQAVEKHLQQVPADMKLPVLYLIDSIVKNVGDTYTSLFTQNIVSTFCSVFEKVDERTRAQMFKLRQTWNEVFPAKKLYAVDVRVHSIDPAWPITAVPPTIHVNPKFFRTQQTTTASPTASVPSVTSVVAPIQPVVTPVVVATSIKPTVISTPALPDEDSHTLNEAKMREELLKKQKELLELQQRKLELELMQTKARLEEQQKQLEKQLRPAAPIAEAVSTPLLAALQSETAKLLVTAAAAVTTKTLKNVSSSAVSKTVVTTSQTTVSEATVTTTATSPAKGSRAASANSRSKSESVTTVAAGKTSSVTAVTSTSRPVPTSAVTTTAPSTRSRDPRLASRQVQQPAIVPVNNSTAQSEDEESEEPDTVFDQVKLETSKPKPQITINLGCANKGTINKDSRGISKKDPRLLSKKVQGITSSIKGQTLSATNSGGSGKGGNKLSGRGPSPKPSSPSRTSSSSGGGGKTSASSSSSSSATSSPRKQQSKSGNNNASSKQSRNKVLPKLIQIDLTDSPPPKTETKEESISNKEKEKSESSSKTSSSSSKTESHKKKSSPSGPSRSLTSSPSSDRKKGSGKSSSESLSTGGNSLPSNNNKQERGKSPISGEKRRSRERSERDRFISKIDMFGDSDSLESPSPPPPPIISSDSKKRDESSPSKTSAFKDVKQSMKARNYVRRNRPSKSRSPEIPPVAAIPPASTKDVDLRVGGPPEKHPRLNVFQPEIKVSPASAEEEMKKPLVEAVSKDVDLRQLPTSSPGKKRPSMERAEQPPQKKSKAEVYDELFGREDVDLRQLPPAVAIVKPTNLPPSPPPPPIISQPSPVPTSTSSQDSSANTANSPKRVSPDREKGVEAAGEEKFAMEDDSKENSDSGLKPRGWAKYKEIYKTPLRSSFSHEDVEQSEPQGPKNSPRLNSPLRERETMFGTPRSMLLRRAEKFDKLGRRLLYNRSSDDPDERQRSVNSEDTDMRQRFLDDDCGGHDINVYNIILQADEQLKNGTITSRQYNTLLTQVIQLNEVQKLREAQRKDKLEDKENWERSRRRRGPPLEMSPDIGQLSPISADEDSEGSVPPMGAKFDIDERLLLQPRLPPTASVPSPPEPSIPPSGNFQPGPALWSDMGHPPMVSGGNRWEHPRPWLQGAPPPPLASGPLVPGHLPPHVQPVHLVNQPPPGPPFHRPPGPEFRPVGNFGGMQRWGGPRFQSRELDRHFEPRLSRPDNRFRMIVPREHRRSSASGELPLADPMLLDLIEQDTMKTINIDGVPREIRFYGDTAIVMLSWDDPREIGFQSGTRRIIFDERESIVCALNDTYRDFIIDGRSHSIRLGSPTREFYIDGKWYECFFGGPPINIEIGGKIHSVKLEGPPPPVKIGFVKRTDLVAGKINLIINAMTMVPIFLDAKPQRFDIEEKPHVLRFVDALTTVLLNGQPMKVEFGGLPKPIVVRGKKHFIRFSVLPDGIKPGYVKIINMEGRRLSSPPRKENENSNSGFGAGDEDSNDAKFQIGHDPVLPVLGNASRAGRGLRRTFGSEKGRDSPQESEHASGGSPGHFHTDNAVMGPVVPVHQPRPKQLVQMPLEMLTSLMPTVMAPASGCSYQVEQDSQDGQQKPPALQQQAPAQTPVGVSEPSVPTSSATAGIPFLPMEINVDELFQKLVATGIVPEKAEKAEVDSKKEEEVRSIKHVDFKQPDTLKVRQPGVVAILYSGIQCSSCGVRFPPEQTMKYSQHLDWHFRQNRRDRDNTRKAQSRKWYYDVSDWIQFEEIEDLEERAQSWFETQQATGEEEKEIQEVPSVCAGENPEDTFCDVCHDKFEQFYNEEREEWHLRAAVRVDGKTYHPLCYEDYKASLEEPSVIEEHKEDDAEKKKEGEDDGKKDEVETEVKEEEGVKEEKTEEAMDTSEPVEVKTEVLEEETKTEEKDAAKVENMEEDSKEIKEEPPTDVVMKEEPAESEQKPDTESQVKTESEEKEAEESMVEEDLQPMPTAVDTTTTAVASSIDGNVQFEESSQIAQTGPISGKIKINISKSLATASKDTQEEGDADMSTAVQSNDNESGPIATETSRESGEEGVCEEVVNSGEPPPPGVEPLQLKPKLVGRKLTELPPVMKGTELSGLCSIM